MFTPFQLILVGIIVIIVIYYIRGCSSSRGEDFENKNRSSCPSSGCDSKSCACHVPSINHFDSKSAETCRVDSDCHSQLAHTTMKCDSGTCVYANVGGQQCQSIAMPCAPGVNCYDEQGICESPLGGKCDSSLPGGVGCIIGSGNICSSSGTCIPTGSQSNGDKCELSSDCLQATCYSGICTPIDGDPCIPSIGCANMSSCVNGVCGTGLGSVCTDGSDCLVGTVCASGICQAPSASGGPCVKSIGCSNMSSCVNGACSPGLGSVCDGSNPICPVGTVCASGICQLPIGGMPCVSTVGCASKNTCTGGTCIGSTGGACMTAKGCTSKDGCVNGVCTKLLGAGAKCTSSSQCLTDACIGKECT